jgi:transposase
MTTLSRHKFIGQGAKLVKKYNVTLTQEERERLENIILSGKSAARKITRARILLKADSGKCGPGYKDEDIKEALDVGINTVANIRQRFVQEGLEEALVNRPSSRVYKRKLDGDAEARLATLACSSPPEGRDSWTLKLLADRMVELEYVDSISDETIRRTLKKMNSSLGKRSNTVSRRKQTQSSSTRWKMY